MSADVDVTIRLTPDRPSAFVEAMRDEGFSLRVSDPHFVERTRAVPFVAHRHRMPVDVVLAGSGLEDRFLSRVRSIDTLGGAGGEAGRADLVGVLRASGGDQAQRDDVSPALRMYLLAFEALPPAARAMAADAARDVELTLGDVPDGSLASDWQYLLEQIAGDLEMPPSRALADLDRVRRCREAPSAKPRSPQAPSTRRVEGPGPERATSTWHRSASASSDSGPANCCDASSKAKRFR